MKKFRRIFCAVMATAMLITFAPAFTTAHFGNTGGTMSQVVIDEETNGVCHCGLPMIRQTVIVPISIIGPCQIQSHNRCTLYNAADRNRARCINTGCDTWIWVSDPYNHRKICW